MNYEEFYEAYSEIAKRLREQIATHQKLLRRINTGVEKGDLKAAARELPAANAVAADCVRSIASVTEQIESADMRAYLESGDFARQLMAFCEERHIDIKGEGNAYEMFPYRLKIDPQSEELLVNKRKAVGLRPLAIVNDLEKKRDKLLAASFNPSQYATELAAGYDMALWASAAAKGRKPVPGTEVHLMTVYKYLTPMRRFKREYDAQSYAFDLARLHNHSGGTGTTDNGRTYRFGSSRDINKAIRIIDALGAERYLGTVSFFDAE
jgi:hypothetical protein